MAGSEIQATGIVEFQDCFWTGSLLKLRNGLHRVCTMPGVLPGVMCKPKFLWGQTEFQSAEVHVDA